MFRMLILLFLASLGSLTLGHAFAADPRSGAPRRAILLVAFGTSVPEAQKAFERIEAQTRRAYDGVEVRWAYTSKIIRAKLAKQGKVLDSPEMALARLMEDGYTRVAVLSLHVTPGKEFHDLYRNVQLFGEMEGGFERIAVAPPLLSSQEDMERVAKALLTHVPADRKPEDAVIFIGHGNEKHPADAVYGAMNFLYQDLAPNVFVGTVQGYPSAEDLLPKLVERKIKKVYLIPFMTVAGEHARNDMAGDKPESYKSVLMRNGIACESVMAGIAEYPDVVEVWLDHLRSVFAAL